LLDELADETGDATLEGGGNLIPFMSFKSKDGFSHTLSHDNIVVEFSYRVGTRSETGKLPELVQPKVRPYTEIVSEAVNRLVRIGKTLGKSVSLNRAGFVASVKLGRKALPPGLDAFAKHLDSFWKTPLVKLDGTFVVKLETREGSYDQCHHSMQFDAANKERPDEVEVKLDWQRVFEPEKTLRLGEMEKDLLDWMGLATSYFEKVGEGAVGR